MVSLAPDSIVPAGKSTAEEGLSLFSTASTCVHIYAISCFRYQFLYLRFLLCLEIMQYRRKHALSGLQSGILFLQ